jgi:lysophospholipase L1-like esterase
MRRARMALPAALLALAVLWPARAHASTYVAMGDSYTSGPGLAPAAEGSPPECARSQINYPHLVASALGLTLDDVSCSGSSRYDFTHAQYAEQPPQFEALSEATEVVSVSMGGNDNDIYGRLVNGCEETDSADPQAKGAPCKAKYGKAEDEAIKEDTAPYIEELAQIRVLAPHAKVFVVGYPEITARSGPGCPSSVPYTAADDHWINALERKLNAMLQKAAKKDRYTYVNTFTASEGHDACQPLDVRWVEPAIDPADGASLHPNAAGHEADAIALEKAMRAAGVS